MPTLTRPRHHLGSVPRSITLLLCYLVLSLGAAFMLFPFVWMITSAFKTQAQILATPPVWIPSPATTYYLKRVWNEYNFQRYMLNSLGVTSVVTAVALYTSSLIGYVLAKFRFRGREVFFLGVLATWMIPSTVLLIPQYQVARVFHLLNSYLGLLMPGIYSTVGIFLIRQFMHSIPNELLDAARVDGCSELGIFHRIVLPNLGPALGSLAIFTFVWNWNSFLWPLVVISKQSMYTVPVGLALFKGQFALDYGSTLAGATISVLPVLVVFLLFQRWITRGVVMTGLKG